MYDTDREVVNALQARIAALEGQVHLVQLLSWAALVIAVVLSMAAVLIAQG